MKYVSLSGRFILYTIGVGYIFLPSRLISTLRYGDVKRENRNLIIAAAAAAVVFVAAYACIALYAGSTSPFYTVESGSMMHSENSKVGIIDTGDMVIVRAASKADIVTYVEGHGSGYKKFGDFGDVILYERPGGAAVIHRALFYVSYNAGGTWDVSSLYGYGGSWYLTGYAGGTYCYEVPGGTLSADSLKEVRGVLAFENFGYDGKGSFIVNLDVLPKVSGYITKGDRNQDPDQSNGISGAAVGADRIIGVAGKEVPWLGCIKLFVTGNNADRIPGNSVILLIATFVLIVAAIFAANFIYERYVKKERNG